MENKAVKTYLKNLNKWDDAYYNGEAIVSDKRYDAYRDSLEVAYKNKEISDKKMRAKVKAYLSKTGAPPKPRKASEGRRDATLAFFVGSLAKLKADDMPEFQKWVKQIYKAASSMETGYKGKDHKDSLTRLALMVTPKFDGISLTLKYEKGKLVDAYTRGDGTQGQSKIRHAKLIPTIPHTISNFTKQTIYVRGELVAHNRRFKEINDAREEKARFKTVLSATSGWINADEPDYEFLPAFDFYAFNLHLEDGSEIGQHQKPSKCVASMSEHGHRINTLDELGACSFLTPQYDVVVMKYGKGEKKTFDGMVSMLEKIKKRFTHPVDGVVVDVCCAYLRGTLGFNKQNRPLFAKALKFSAAQDSVTSGQITKVHTVEVNVSKSGELVPTLIFDPVNIKGATVQRASGYNFHWMNERKIGVGTTVSVVKAGDIVPQASFVSGPVTTDLKKMKCLCGEKTVVTEGAVFCAKPLKCRFTQRAVLLNTIKKLKIKGMGPKVIETLFANGYETFADLVRAKSSDLEKLPRFGATLIETILNLNENLKTLSEAELMEVSGVFTSKGLSLSTAALTAIVDKGDKTGDRYALYQKQLPKFEKWKSKVM